MKNKISTSELDRKEAERIAELQAEKTRLAIESLKLVWRAVWDIRQYEHGIPDEQWATEYNRALATAHRKRDMLRSQIGSQDVLDIIDDELEKWEQEQS